MSDTQSSAPPPLAARRKKSTTSSKFDQLIVCAVIALAVVMSLVVPLAYICRESGSSFGETLLYAVQRGVVLAHHSRVGHVWPISDVLNAVVELDAFRSLKGVGVGKKQAVKVNLFDADGVPLEPGTRMRYPDVFADDDKLLDLYAADDSYTRFEDTAIFFRVLPRKVPISPESGKPELHFLYELTGGDQTKSRQVKDRLTRERKAETAQLREENLIDEETGRVRRPRRRTVNSFGMAEIDPATNELNASAKGTIPCIHPTNDIFADFIQAMLRKAVIVEDTYVKHAGDPYGTLSFGVDHVRPCVARILPMMCVGDKWEVICPRNMTSSSEKVPLRSYTFRIDVRELVGPTRTMDEAEEALARGVFLTEKDENGEVVDVRFTRQMFLERAKRRPPRLVM